MPRCGQRSNLSTMSARPGSLRTMTSPAGTDSTPRRTSWRRVVASAVGAAVVMWLLSRFALDASVGESTLQALVVLTVILGGIA